MQINDKCENQCWESARRRKNDRRAIYASLWVDTVQRGMIWNLINFFFFRNQFALGSSPNANVFCGFFKAKETGLNLPAGVNSFWKVIINKRSLVVVVNWNILTLCDLDLQHTFFHFWLTWKCETCGDACAHSQVFCVVGMNAGILNVNTDDMVKPQT